MQSIKAVVQNTKAVVQNTKAVVQNTKAGVQNTKAGDFVRKERFLIILVGHLKLMLFFDYFLSYYTFFGLYFYKVNSVLSVC